MKTELADERAARKKAEDEATKLREELTEARSDRQARDKEKRVTQLRKKNEATAKAKLESAKALMSAGKKEAAKKWLREIVDEFPDTDAAADARKLVW